MIGYTLYTIKSNLQIDEDKQFLGYTLYTIKSNLQIDEDKQFILIFFTKQMLICAIYMFNSVSFIFEIYFLVMDILSSIYMLCLIHFVTLSII